jgi:hypothetical protein
MRLKVEKINFFFLKKDGLMGIKGLQTYVYDVKLDKKFVQERVDKGIQERLNYIKEKKVLSFDLVY